MQTFLPVPDFRQSARMIDPSRLGNQVWREVMTLLRGGWPHHPASRMWARYQPALAAYGLACVDELHTRVLSTGRRPDYTAKPWYQELEDIRGTDDLVLPDWLGDERVHASHRGTLLYKNFRWYSQYGWAESPLPPDPVTGKFQYFWPV